jgi:ankyrin repeat protein
MMKPLRSLRLSLLPLFLLICMTPVSAQTAPPQTNLDKAFLDAVQDRALAKMQTLLTQGANINAREPINGAFALHYAINWPDLSLVKWLLDKGADVNLADKSGYTALTDAAHNDGPEYTAIVKLLIERDANIHARHDEAVFGAAKNAEPEVLQLLIKKGAPVNARSKDNENSTVLMFAAGGASVAKVQLLLDAGADIKAADDKGETALMKAVSVDHRFDAKVRLPMISLLLSKGAEINAKDKQGRTALLHAVVQYMSEAGGIISHPEVVQFLLENGADVQAKDNDGNTALIDTAGVYQGPIEIARLLLAKGIEVDARNAKGLTALMVAVDKGGLDVTQLLLEKGADANQKDAVDHTVLDHAIEAGNAELVKVLLAKGAVAGTAYKTNSQILAATTNFALLNAAARGNLPKVKELLANGADVNARDTQHNTALLLNAQLSYSGVEVPTLLLEKGADIDAVNDNGESALMLSAGRNSQDEVKLFLTHKANVNFRSKKGERALHLAATGLHSQIVNALLASGAEVDARDADGKTALIRATDFEGAVPDDVMQALLDKGAQINAQDDEGNTALILATKSGSMSGVEFLLSKGAKVDLKNKAGQTALMYARLLHGNQKLYNANLIETRIVLMLVKAGAKE